MLLLKNGVSVIPMRSDNLEKINDMLLGSVRHPYIAMDQSKEV